MQFNIAICDDDPTDANTISEYLKDFSAAEITISIFSDARELMKTYNHAGAFDIVFLDVEMPVIDGLILAKQIRLIPDYDVKIIFVSSYPEYMQRSFDVQAYHYLEKPAEKEKLYMILEHIINEKCAKNDQKIIFTDKYSTHYIRPDDLYYVDIDRSSYRNIRLHFDDDSIIMHIKIKDCEKILRPFNFIYVYRSTLVNLKYLHIVGSDSVTLVNKVRLKLSRRHMQHVQEEYVRYNAEIISNKNKFL